MNQKKVALTRRANQGENGWTIAASPGGRDPYQPLWIDADDLRTATSERDVVADVRAQQRLGKRRDP